MARERRYLPVGEANPSGLIDDDHGVRRGVEDAAGEFRRKRLHVR